MTTSVDLGYYMPAFEIPAARELIAELSKFGVVSAVHGVKLAALRSMVAGGLLVPAASHNTFVTAPGVTL